MQITGGSAETEEVIRSSLFCYGVVMNNLKQNLLKEH